MNIYSKKKIRLKAKIFSLMDEIQNHLKKDPNIDNFLDKSLIIENWKKLIPKSQYPIFVIAVLNNIRSDAVINTILDSISRDGKKKFEPNIKISKRKLRSSFGEQPFS